MERPIIFSGEMVRAILEDRKTQTRRVIKPQPNLLYGLYSDRNEPVCNFKLSPFVQGMRLWVRESWWIDEDDDQPIIFYAATDQRSDIPLKPPIFMPRWASRITLEIVNVRVERIHDISNDDVVAEGIPEYTFARGCISDNPPDLRWKFIELWDSINAKRGYGWDTNCFVWVLTFKLASIRKFGDPVHAK